MVFIYNYPHHPHYLFSPSLLGRVFMPVVLLARVIVSEASRLGVRTYQWWPHLDAHPSLPPPPPVLSIDPLYIYGLCDHRRRPTWPRNGRVAAMQTLM